MRVRWVSFPAVTGYYVENNSLPETPPTDYLCTIERFITVLYGRTIKHLQEPALTKMALYQHILKTAYQGPCVWVSTRIGEMTTKFRKL